MRARRSGAERRRMAHVLVDRFGPAVWRAVRNRMGETPEAEDAFVDLMLAVWMRMGRRGDVMRLGDHVERALLSLGISSPAEADASQETPDMLNEREGEEAFEETGLPEEGLPDLPLGLRNRALQRLRAQIAYEEAEVRRSGSRVVRATAGALAVLGFGLVGYGWWGERSSGTGPPADVHRASPELVSTGDLPVALQAVFDITRQPIDLGHLAFGGGELVTGSLSLGAQGDGIQLSAYALHGQSSLAHPRWTCNVAISPPAPSAGGAWLLRSWSLSSAGPWAVVTVNWTDNGIHGTASRVDVYAVPLAGGSPSRLVTLNAGDGGEVVIATGPGGIAWQVVSGQEGKATASPVHLATIVGRAGSASLGPSVRIDVNGLIRNPHVTRAGLVYQGTSASPAAAGTWVCVAPTGQATVYAGVPGATDGTLVDGESGVLYAVAPVPSPQGQTLAMCALHAPGSRQPSLRLEVPVSSWGADGGYVDYVERTGGRTYLVVARAD
ncbi:hypothetical protein [Alicyclobacillus sendaiensis]|uniref:Uncharacterized protein n=1 Tax=Alicyclobacillus sendaiensis PA2 TaxID=3029425 RepID=A0ABT6Y0N9_ALISE|nr:hypothetical protein [Alicyclobacillus sendaiensis]MDI9260909.1 hypothetical protein [Alicyclobacillus sendaiensis PA2]